MKTVWFALALLGLVYGVEVNDNGLPVDAGMSAVGSIWTTKDKDGPKVVAGINCYKNTSDDTLFHMVFRVYNVDQARQDDGTEPYFLFTQCQALQRDQIVNNMQLEADPKCPLTQSGVNDTYFLFESIIDTAAASQPCGIEVDGTTTTIYKFAFRCQRWGSYHAQYDRIFLGQCDFASADQTLVATLDNMVQVGPVATQPVKRRYKVTMGFVKSETDPDPATDALLGTTPVNLGDPIFIQFGLFINNDAGADDTRTMFDLEFGPMGLKIKKCTAKRHTDQLFDAAEGTDTDPGTNGVEFIVGGCGVATPVSQQTGGKRPKWIKASTDGDNSQRMSPNYWYFGSNEAVLFLSKTIGAGTWKTSVICEIEPATSETDTIAFGDIADAEAGKMNSPGYDTCAKRRRRSMYSQNFNNITDFPTTVSADLTIIVKEEDVSGRQDKARCIENTTFYTLTGILSALLLIVLAIGGYLTLKLRRAMNDRERDDSSVSGIPNKAYY